MNAIYLSGSTHGQPHPLNLHSITIQIRPITTCSLHQNRILYWISNKNEVFLKWTNCRCFMLIQHTYTSWVVDMYTQTGQCSINMLGHNSCKVKVISLRSKVTWAKWHAHAHPLLRVVHIPKLGNVASIFWPQQMPQDFFKIFNLCPSSMSHRQGWR